MFRVMLSRILGMFRRRRLDEELDDELRTHLELLRERFERRGMDSAEAYRAALRQFGGVTQVKLDLRERRSLPQLDSAARDVRGAFRRLRRSARTNAFAALTLALGIGAAVAVMAVFHTVVLQPLPYREPDRLVSLNSMDRRNAPEPSLLSYPDFFDFRRQNRVFEHLVSYRDSRFTLSDSLPAVQVTGEIVSWDLFQLLGVRIEPGHGFRPEDEVPGTRAVVLSHELWTSSYGGDTEIPGRAVTINGMPYAVAGVAPRGFRFPLDMPSVQLWVTLAADSGSARERGARMLDAIGRLKPGVSAGQAEAQMNVLASALARQYPASNGNIAATRVQPELERLTARAGKAMWILLGAVALVLLIACANVASLLLARSTERAREFALQLALGASRLALVRSLLIESLVLGALGTAGGVGFAAVVLQAVVPLAGDRVPRLADASIDTRVLIFSALLAVLTSVLAGLAPALQAAGADPVEGLKSGSRSIAPGRDRFRSALVVGQVTLGLVLLVGAEILVGVLLRQVHQDPGFHPENLLTFDIGFPEARYQGAAQVAFCDGVLERLRAIPGVEMAAAGRPLPLQGHEMRVAFDIEDRPAAAPSRRPRSDVAIVTPGYFAAIGIPLLRGRDFSDQDDSAALPAVIVNQAFAERFFHGADAIGRRIRPGVGAPPGEAREIVGVVGNARQAPIGSDPDPIYYFPYRQLPWGIGTVVMRTSGAPREVEAAALGALTELDRQAAVNHVRTGEALSTEVLAPARFLTVLMGGFATLALLLTAAGLYGVLSYMVSRRRREIGVRIALGAGRGEVVALVMRRAALLVTAGLILGSVAAVVLGRLLGSAISEVPAGVPSIVATACCIIAITSSLAAVLPATRAASVDPTVALRSE